MDRPPSLSTSVPAQWRPRSHGSILVRAIHLLDLDQLATCPSITESTFSNSSTSTLQHRIKSAEWLLYHLLNLHSPEETQARLAPHFPPTSTPMQSLTLRAALYRYLSELKKNGSTLLPREAVLRKTMLDECRGERFEELLAGIAMGVLRCRVGVRREARGRGMGGSMGMGTMAEGRAYASASKSGSGTEKGTGRGGGRPPTAGTNYISQTTSQDHRAEDLVSLILAHRVSLQHSLQRRQNIHQKATAYSQHLERLRDDVSARRRRVSTQPDADPEEISNEEYEALRRQVVRAFGAERRWVEYLFHGCPVNSSNGKGSGLELTPESLEWPFDDDDDDDHGQATLRDRDDALYGDHDADGVVDVAVDVEEPMKHLLRSIAQHQDHTRRLQEVRDSLAATRTAPERPVPTPSPARIKLDGLDHHDHIAFEIPARLPAPTRFNKHQTLTVDLHMKGNV